MTKNYSRFIFKILKYIGVFICLILVMIFLFCTTLVEYIIEKNDETWIGRQIEISVLKINPFRGTIHILDLIILEQHSDQVFAGAHEVKAQVNVRRLFKREFNLVHGTISQLTGRIAHQGTQFNWDDIATRLSQPDGVDEPENTKRWTWQLNNLNITGRRLLYINEQIDHQIIIDSIHIQSPTIQHGNPEINVTAFINLGDSGGILHNIIDLNYKDLYFDWTLDINQFSFHLLLPYLQEYLHASELQGLLSTKGRLTGNFSSIEDLNTGADLLIERFNLLDDQLDTVVSFHTSLLRIDTVDLKNKFFQFDLLRIDKPYVRYQLFEEGDNISRLVKTPSQELDSIAGDRVSLPGREYFNVFIYLAEYANYLVQNYFESDYQADSLSITNGRIHFTDYTMPQRAVFDFNALNVTARQFDSRSQYVSLEMDTEINRDGKMIARWNVDPHDPLEMELKYTLDNFSMTGFHPYAVFHTGFPFYGGSLKYDGFINIHNRRITSENHISIQDFDIGKRISKEPPVKIPLRLAASLLRDKKGIIEIDLPVEGDLNNPRYKYWNAVWDALSNNLLKVVTAPYNLLARAFEVDESSLREIPFEYLQDRLEMDQEKRIHQIQKVLKGKGDLKLQLFPVNNRELEGQKLAAFLVKEQYYRDSILRDSAPLSREDSIGISKLDDLDSNLVSYVNNYFSPGNLPSTREERFERIVGLKIINQKVDSICNQRNVLVISLLSQDPEMDPRRFEFWKPEDPEMFPDTTNLARPYYLLHFDLISEDDILTN